MLILVPFILTKFKSITCTVRIEAANAVEFFVLVMVDQFAQRCAKLKVSLLLHALAIAFKVDYVQILLHNHAVGATENGHLSFFLHVCICKTSQ